MSTTVTFAKKFLQQTHDLEREKIECDKCLKLLPKNALTTHKIYCYNIRNYPCNMCSKKFHFTSFLKRHVKTVHLKQRIFKCSICPKSYTDGTPLRHHMNSSHGDGSTFSHCLLCQKTFTTSRRFLEHNEKFHKENANDSKRDQWLEIIG